MRHDTSQLRWTYTVDLVYIQEAPLKIPMKLVNINWRDRLEMEKLRAGAGEFYMDSHNPKNLSKKAKTYNSQDSHVVTHRNTN